MINNLKSLLSFGNSKLPKTTAIFNFSSATACRSKELGLCKLAEVCYAMKAERIYPNVKPFRERQSDYWKDCTADQFIFDFIDAIVRKRNKVTALRFSEAGDFLGQSCLDKAEEIAKNLTKIGVKVYTYTANSALDYSKCKHLIINGSGFKAKGIKRQFIAVNQFSGNSLKCVGDCNICKLCLSNTDKDIEVLLH